MSPTFHHPSPDEMNVHLRRAHALRNDAFRRVFSGLWALLTHRAAPDASDTHQSGAVAA